MPAVAAALNFCDNSAAVPYTASSVKITLKLRQKGNPVALLNHAKCSPESISCSYARATPNHLLPADDELAVVNFGGRCGDAGQAGVLCTGLVQLQQPAMVESWFSTLATERGVAGQCHWSSNGESLFAALYVDEQQLPSQRQAIQHAYNQLLALSRSRGYPHLIRVWNYMADIMETGLDNEPIVVPLDLMFYMP